MVGQAVAIGRSVFLFRGSIVCVVGVLEILLRGICRICPSPSPSLSASQVPVHFLPSLGLDGAYARGTIVGVCVCGCAGAGACVRTERVFGACIMFGLCSNLSLTP